MGLDYSHISSTISQNSVSDHNAKLDIVIELLQEIDEEIDDFQDELNVLDLNYELPKSTILQTQLLQEVLVKTNFTENTKYILMYFWNKDEANTLDNLYCEIEKFTIAYWKNFRAVYNLQRKFANTILIENKHLDSQITDREDNRKNIKINFIGNDAQLAQLIKHLQLNNFLEQNIIRKDLAEIVASCFLVKKDDIDSNKFHNTLDKAYSADSTRKPSNDMANVISKMKNLKSYSDNLTN